MRRSSIAAVVASVFVAASCAQILGLDGTQPPIDTGIDAPDACQGMPMCVGSGRQICGQLVQTGAAAGQILRAAAPTGGVCAVPATGDGPCAIAVTGGTIDQLASGSDLVAGSIDDCGRFVVDLDPAGSDVAVVFEGAGYARTARAVLGRPMQPGTDVVTGLAVTNETESDWSTQLLAALGSGSGSAGPVPPDTTSGFLVQYTADSAPLAGEAAASNGSSPFTNAPGTTPWAAYFTGAFDAFDPTATHTGSAGAAFVVTGEGSGFSLEGFRPGKRCKAGPVRQISGALLFVVETDC